MVTASYDNMIATHRQSKPAGHAVLRFKDVCRHVMKACCVEKRRQVSQITHERNREWEVTTTKGSLEQCSSYVFHLLLLKLWYRTFSLCLDWTSVTDCSGAHTIVLRDREAFHNYHICDASWWCGCRWVHLIDVVECQYLVVSYYYNLVDQRNHLMHLTGYAGCYLEIYPSRTLQSAKINYPSTNKPLLCISVCADRGKWDYLFLS